MADTARFSQYKVVSGTGAGTTVLLDRPGTFERVVLGQNKTGTVTFYDVATAGGSADTNLVAALDNTSGTIPSSVEMGFRVKKGLIAVLGGTTSMTVVYN